MVFNFLRVPKSTHSVFPKCRDNLLSTNQLEHDSITSDNFCEIKSGFLCENNIVHIELVYSQHWHGENVIHIAK